tara:strand:- start:1048 stop:2469 length:1422 start_codon:yes stop_codon:yes gene_type:complete
MKQKISIHWFKQDLRLRDNPSINYLSEKEEKTLFIYIWDNINDYLSLGSASKVWLHHSLEYLNKQLNGKLLIFDDSAINVFKKLIQDFKISSVSWNRCYDQASIKNDAKIKIFLKKHIEDVKSFNGSLLWEPWEILKADGTPFKVFTPFYKNGCLAANPPRKPLTKKIKIFDSKYSLNKINFLKPNKKNNWAFKITNEWKIGEEFAYEAMNNFFKFGITDYKEGRNFPSKQNVSKLSPFIHWGQISPNTLWWKCNENNINIKQENIDTFKSELGWREFSYYLLFHFPHVTEKNLQVKFDNFDWEFNKIYFERWTKGQTGYPIVDAGMRELWETGYMHNRVRMIVGSFLVKNLLIHWKKGERWFWDCLFDADVASNSSSWQWVAGTGADAAPYFRIFNPVTQGQKFDPDGEYTKKYVPELTKLPLKYLFNPWDCPENISKEIEFEIGKNYPNPIVNLKESREKALKVFASLKKF